MNQEMYDECNDRAITLCYKGNVGDKVLLMKSGLVTITATKTDDRWLKVRVALYNNKHYRLRDVLIYDIMRDIINMTNEVADL